MLRRLLIGALIWLGLSAGAFAQGAGNFRAAVLSGGCPLGSKYYLNFSTGQYCGLPLSSLSITHTTTNGSATNLLPTSPSGFAYTTFATNQAPITPGLGVLVEETRENFLANSNAPATQTTGSLGTGTYTLWVNGSGSATMSLGTGVGCGVASATQGNPISFTLTVAGTCTITKTGSLNAFQLELNPGTVSNPTSLIVTAANAGIRNGLTMKALGVAFPSSYTLYGIASPNSPVTYATAQTIAEIGDGTANNRFAIRRDNTDGIPKILLETNGTATINANLGGASAWAQYASGKIAMFGAPGSQRAAFNNLFDTNSYTSAMPVGVNQLWIGQDDTGIAFCNCYVSVVAVIPANALSR
jgi:hypothetical protein